MRQVDERAIDEGDVIMHRSTGHPDRGAGVETDDPVSGSTGPRPDPSSIFADPVTYLARFGLDCVLVEIRALPTAA